MATININADLFDPDRAELMRRSNNPADPRKNLCASAVAEAFNVEAEYLHTIFDMLPALAQRFKIGIATDCLNLTRAGIRKQLKKAPRDVAGVAVMIDGHIYALTGNGEIIADTAPRARGRVIAAYTLTEKK